MIVKNNKIIIIIKLSMNNFYFMDNFVIKK